MGTISGISLALDSYEFREIDNAIIEDIIDNSEENTEMYHFLKFVRTNSKLDKTYLEKIEYYTSILNKVLSITKIKYAPEFFDLFLAFIMKQYMNIEKESKELVEKVISDFDLISENFTDEIWYIFYSLKFTLLNTLNFDAMFSSNEKIEETKKFIEDLKNNKERYENIEERFRG